MKLRPGHLNGVLVLVAIMMSSAAMATTISGTGRASHGHHVAAAAKFSADDSIPTIEVSALEPRRDVTSTVVVSTVRNGGSSASPLLVLFVMTLFGSLLMRLRQVPHSS